MKKVFCLLIILILVFPMYVFADNIPVTGIQVEKTYIKMEIGQTERIVVSFTPINATNKSMNWVSSNSNVVRVNSYGEIKGISAGIATIKGTTVDGGYTVNISVNVSGESSITSEKYLMVKKMNALNEEVRYITKIVARTSVSDFKNNVSTYSNMDFYDLVGNKMSDLDYIISGTKLKLSDNSQYVLSVTGDINSNGDVSIVDLSRLKLKIVGLSTLDEYQEEAADVNFDGNVSLTDLSILKQYIVGLKTEF